jgi:hypothetical protein
MPATRIWLILIASLCVRAIAAEPNVSSSPATAVPKLEFDHVWIVVTRDAPERAALERAGLKVSPGVNRNDGQGTASVAAEFVNSYLELMWPDPTVSIAPGAERGVEKFKNRMNWRTSGWCPIGIGLHRLGQSAPLPFPTWTIAPDWMPKGNVIEILTARDDTKSPSFFIEPLALAVKEKGNSAAMQHPAGVGRVTEIQLIRPAEYQPVPAFTYLENARIFKSREGKEWAIEVTFDAGRGNQTKDLRPDLPLILNY